VRSIGRECFERRNDGEFARRYLPPLRDASLGLRPSRSSQLARLLHILADDAGRLGIDRTLKELDAELKKHPPLMDIQSAVSGHHETMLGAQLAQALEVGLSASDFQRFASRLSLMVDSFEIEQNGLGFNNLIFMAVVLSELAKNLDRPIEADYRGTGGASSSTTPGCPPAVSPDHQGGEGGSEANCQGEPEHTARAAVDGLSGTDMVEMGDW